MIIALSVMSSDLWAQVDNPNALPTSNPDPPRVQSELFAVPEIESTWQDLLSNVHSLEDWRDHRQTLRRRYLDLIRDQFKPDRVPLDLEVEEAVIVDGVYERRLVSYQVELNERARAYIGIPCDAEDNHSLPGIVALHGTFAQGIEQAAGLVDNPEKAYLDHLCRRGYVVIAPEHFVSGSRIPPEGPYDTTKFHERHPNWTSVGKFTYEHSIAVDVLASLPQVDPERLGAMGHSLGGQGTMFLAAYDERIKVAAGNCAAAFFRHNPDVLEWSRDRWYVYFKPLRAGLLEGEMPAIDFHEIMALVAPRAYLDVAGLNDGTPATQRQRALMLLEVSKVWELENRPQDFAFFLHGMGHSVPHETRALIYAWLDHRLKPPDDTTPRLVRPTPSPE
ncbi:MAG: dienelactone hydrolase family protein [Planctomycetales bacterium]|nr:dienelactone hydrolase family protein [Planctomycetales bacterium]